MIGGLEGLPEDIAQLRHDLDELKGRQLVGWDSFVTHRISSSATYDLSPTLAAGQTRRYQITLNFNQARAGALATLDAFFRTDNPAVMAFPSPRPAVSSIQAGVWWYQSETANTYTRWILTINNKDTVSHIVYIKLFFAATASGVFSIVAI